MKKVLSFILVLSMVLGSMGMAFAAPTEAAQDAIDAMVDLGFVEGDEGGLRLEDTIKRSEVAVIGVRIAGLEDIAKKSNYQGAFTDVSPAKWDNPVMNGSINVAAGQNLVKGYPDGTFAPDADVTNAEIITLMVRLAVSADEIVELDKGVWPAAYITKAAELGILANTNIENYGEAATRETVFVLGFNANAIVVEEEYYVVQALVLENDRVERVGKDEVVVEVIKEVQRADFAESSRKDRGDQLKLDVAELANVEDLLGKVVNISLDKNDKAVKVEVDNTYEYLTGAIKTDNNKLTLNKKNYTVSLDERYDKEDDRIFRTYLNNDSMKYVNFAADKGGAEFARVTVKNGKVIFIDAFDFDDIMPVKEITKIREKDTIVSYDDVRDGNTIETTVSDARVILVNDKVFTIGTLEDVRVDNVIHTYKVGTKTNYVVLQDKAIEGKLERIVEDKDGEYVVVDGKEYTIPREATKQSVYEFKSNDKFYTLDAITAYKELDTFRGEEVRVLLALNGKVQYVGSKIELNEYVGVATRIVGKDMRVLNSDNKTNDYGANLDTKVTAGQTTTGHSGLNIIERNSLVYVNVNGETLVAVEDLTAPKTVNTLTEREVNGLRITDETAVFVVNTNNEVEARAIKDVVKAYDKLADTDKVRISLIDELAYDKVSVRGYKFGRVGNVHTMLVTNLDIAPAAKDDAIYGKLIKYDNRRVGKSDITVELSNGARRTFVLDKEVNEDKVDFKEGAIYEITESKETDNLALAVNKVKYDATRRVESVTNYGYTFTNGTDTLYETRKTEIFGKRPIAGDTISYTVNNTNDMLVILNEGRLTATPKGVVTYINVTEGLIEVDGKVLVLDTRVRLADADNKTVAIGPKQVASKLTLDQRVTLKEDRGVVTDIKLVSDKVVDPDPVDPVVVTAEATIAGPAFGQYAVTISIDGATAADVTKVEINGASVDFLDAGTQIQAISLVEVTTVELTIDGETVVATIK